MYSRCSGNAYLTRFKSLVGGCSANTADRPAVWVCCLLNNQGFGLPIAGLCSSASQSPKAEQGGIRKRAFLLLEMILSSYICIYVWLVTLA